MRIHKEGYGIVRNTGITAAIVILALAALSIWDIIPYWVAEVVALVFILIAFFTVMFFRSPSRPLISDPGIVFAPADGKVVVIEEVYDEEYFKEKRLQVSVFMSISNVHSNLYPVSGTIEYFKYHPGRFLVAWHPKSSEHNERTSTVINMGRHKILIRQIAGMIARRIVSYPVVGEKVEQNHKMGFIKFGSRVDLLLPLGSEVFVKIGDKVCGGQTPIARIDPMTKP